MQKGCLANIHPKEKRILGFAGLVVSMPVLVATLLLSEALVNGEFHILPCFQKVVFHKECYTCGMTRSFGAMWKGNIRLACAYNRGGPAAFTVFWILFFLGAYFIGENKFFKFWRRNL